MTGFIDKHADPSAFETDEDAAMAEAETSTEDGAYGGLILMDSMQLRSPSPSPCPFARPQAINGPYHDEVATSCVSLIATATSSSTNTDRLIISGSDPVAASSASIPSDPPPPYSSLFDDTSGENCVRPCSSLATDPLPVELETSADLASKPKLQLWDTLPDEIRLRVFSCLRPKELVRASIVSKSFHKLCFDGQLWSSLDATGYYRQIPASSLARIIGAAGPFLQELNLRGCVQMENYPRSDIIVKSCKRLVSATLEGCRSFEKRTLHGLLKGNENLCHLNVAGLLTFTNAACPIIAQSCPNLESLNVSWCPKLDAICLKEVIESCTKLKELRAGEIRGFDCIRMAESIFQTNKLERLVLSGCLDLNDVALGVMMHGRTPETDFSTGRPIVPPRRLRHLDLSRCVRLTSDGVRSIGHVTPDLEALQLSKCRLVTNAGLETIFAGSSRLTHLELDELDNITDQLLSEHLARSPCIDRLEHLSLSSCDAIGDAGVVPVLANCVRLRSAELDNTIISDQTLLAATQLISRRCVRSTITRSRARVALRLSVYDCPHITWSGIRRVMAYNAWIVVDPARDRMTYPTEVVALKCYYGFQMTVDEHTKRVLRGEYREASELERKWTNHMQMNEEYAAAGNRRRRRQALEEDGLFLVAQHRARTLPGCVVM